MILDIELLPYQMEMVRSEAPFLGFIGGTGSGKTFMSPVWLLTKMLSYPNSEWIVSAPTTISMKRTVLKYITAAFDRWGIRYDLNKSDLTMELSFGYVYFISAETPDRLQGIHAKGIIGDEAGLYSREWWQTAIQRISYSRGQILLTTTPYDPNHWLKLEFWDKWRAGDKDFCVVNPTSIDNPFYPKEEYYAAMRRLPKWRFDLLYNAQFPEKSSNALFEYSDVRACIEIDENDVIAATETTESILTVDVAREGTDESVVCIWRGYVLEQIIRYDTNTLTELAGNIVRIVKDRFDAATPIVIDSSGLGAGVYDMLYDDGYTVYGVNFAQRADNDAYANARSEMYHNLADAILERRVKLIDDDYLIGDLIVQERRYNSRGQIMLIPKDKIKENLGRSPDISDAVALRFSSFKSRVGIV